VFVALVVAAPAAAVTPTTVRAVSATGQELNGNTIMPAVSTDGRWLTFASTATNAVAGVTSGIRQIFLLDRSTGQIRLASKGPTGAPGDQASTQPTMSADGRLVVFQSAATNLGAAGVTNTADDVFLYDRTTDAVRRLSTSITGGDGNSWSRDPRITPDGSTVVFTAAADDLVAGDTGVLDVFLVSTAGGAIERVSARPGGTTANNSSVNGDASDGGRYVAFSSSATDLLPAGADNNGVQDIYVLDRQTGVRSRASVTAAGGEGNGTSSYPSMTADGCLIVFNSMSKNLVAGDDNTGNVKVFVRDRCAGNTEYASLRANGTQGSAIDVPPDISDDGCLVAMISMTLTSPAPAGPAVVLRDRCQGVTSRADVSSQGDLGNGSVFNWPRLSPGSGRYVVFDSSSNNLVLGDNNVNYDAFVRDRANAVPPVAALQVAVSGRRVTADASASRDPDAAVASVRIAWGDGSADSAGVTGFHDYGAGGTFSVTATVTDTDGLTATATKSVTIADAGSGGAGGPAPGGGLVPVTLPPAIARLTLTGGLLSRTSFTAVPKNGRVGGRRGALLLLSVSENATVQLRFERVVKGRRSGKTCSAKARKGTRCTLYRAAGTGSAPAKAGDVDVPLTGRTSTGALTPGTYRVTAVARAADGRTSAPVTSTFTFKRR
jgi:Tol biopolymer transport system component